MALAAVTFAIASFVHSGAAIPLGFATVRDPFGGAVVPEAGIAALLAVGAVSILARLRASRPVAAVACAIATATPMIMKLLWCNDTRKPS